MDTLIETQVPTLIHQETDHLHCATCFQLGTNVARHYAIIRWLGSDILWTHTFPCSQSLVEFIAEVSRDATVLESGAVR